MIGQLTPIVVFSGSNQVEPRIAELQLIRNQQEQKVTANKIFARETTENETAQHKASKSMSDSCKKPLKKVVDMPPPSSKKRALGYRESENTSKRHKEGTGHDIEAGQAGTSVTTVVRNQSMEKAGILFLLVLLDCSYLIWKHQSQGRSPSCWGLFWCLVQYYLAFIRSDFLVFLEHKLIMVSLCREREAECGSTNCRGAITVRSCKKASCV